MVKVSSEQLLSKFTRPMGIFLGEFPIETQLRTMNSAGAMNMKKRIGKFLFIPIKFFIVSAKIFDAEGIFKLPFVSSFDDRFVRAFEKSLKFL